MENPFKNLEDLLTMVMIDKEKGVKIEVSFQTDEGEVVDIRETITKLTEWTKDKMSPRADDNTTRSQIFPLMSQAAGVGMTKLMGLAGATGLLADEGFRYSIVHMMTVGFYLLKFLQKNNIKLHTTEVPISPENIAALERQSKQADMLTSAARLGLSPDEVASEMIRRGVLTEEEARAYGLTPRLIPREEKKPGGSSSN